MENSILFRRTNNSNYKKFYYSFIAKYHLEQPVNAVLTIGDISIQKGIQAVTGILRAEGRLNLYYDLYLNLQPVFIVPSNRWRFES